MRGDGDARRRPQGRSFLRRIDFASIAGLMLALGAIVTGLLMEGGTVRDISQITSALIVVGGTIGACMVTTPMQVLAGAWKAFFGIFLETVVTHEALIDEIMQYATIARKNGILALEDAAERIQDPFLKKALGLAVDGCETGSIRAIMNLQIEVSERCGEAEAKVFEAAGGYAPTLGIIGAVMGLIQVMKNLANIDEVGRGIAVAFVATIYGLVLANIVFLPAAAKLKARVRYQTEIKEMTLEGVIGIAEGLNQMLIQTKLDCYLQNHARESGRPRDRVSPALASVAER